MKFKPAILLFAFTLMIISVNAQICVNRTIDFERDNSNTNILQGQIIDTEYNGGTGLGNYFNITAVDNGNGPNIAVAIDSGNPISGNQEFITPGTGSGNANPESKVLILSDNGVDTNSDSLIDASHSLAAGGKLIFGFAYSVRIKKVRVIDVDEENSNIKTYDATNNLRSNIDIPQENNNSVQTLNVDSSNGTRRMEITLTGTAAIASFEYCEMTPPKCGDGTVNQASEQCDDGNLANGDGCTSLCKFESINISSCGDNVCQIYENANICPQDCPVICGNGVIETGENCDGNCPTACNTCNCTLTPLVCEFKCTSQDECRQSSDCGSNETCSRGCTCMEKLPYCDINKGSRCDAKDSTFCKSYEKCNLDPNSCSCIPDGKCHPGLVSGHECVENKDCSSGKMCSGCKCVTRVPVCGDSIIDKPNSKGIYEKCELNLLSACQDNEYCNSNCQCEALSCRKPIDIAILVDPSGSMAEEAGYLCDVIKTINDIAKNDPKADLKYTIKLLGPLSTTIAGAITGGTDGSATCAKPGGDFSGIYTKVYEILKSCSGITFDEANLNLDYAPCESWGDYIRQFSESSFWRSGSLKMALVFSDEDASRGNDADSCNDDPRCGDSITKDCYLADNVCQTQLSKYSWCEQSCAGMQNAKNTYSGKSLAFGYGSTGGYIKVQNVSGNYGQKDWDMIQELIPLAKNKNIHLYTLYDSMDPVYDINGIQILGTGIMGECADKCIAYHQQTLATSTSGAVLKVNTTFTLQKKVFDSLKNLCAGGCPAGTTLCKDGTCSYNCDITDSGPQGCVNQNGNCEFGEGCACPDCTGKQDSCASGAICGSNKLCGCPQGTTLCNDGVCDETCSSHGGKTGCIGQANNVCDSGEGCACPDCSGKQDSCAPNNKCNSKTELCDISGSSGNGCSGDEELCSDGICRIKCPEDEINTTGDSSEFFEITSNPEEKIRILDTFELSIDIKNNLDKTFNNLQASIDLPDKFYTDDSSADIATLSPRETKQIYFKVFVSNYDKEQADIKITIEGAGFATVTKEILLDIDIPEFLVAPDPMQLKKSGKNQNCLDFYYAINKPRISNIADIEMEIINDKLLFGKSLIVDYMSININNQIQVKPMLSNPYCLPAGEKYVVKGYLYKAGTFKITDTDEISSEIINT